MGNPESVLFITLDSCRFDTFEGAQAPNMKSIAPLHQAQAPSYFTYGSHSAMFVGFTPGLAGSGQAFLDPKFGKLFKIVGAGHPGKGIEGFTLHGRNIVEGFSRLGYTTIGAAAMGWFDPTTVTGGHLTDAFAHFIYTGGYDLRRQLSFVEEKLAAAAGPTFTFLNIGETHVPYWHAGASWSPDDNPCQPFQTVDRSAECRSRQTACLEFVDWEIGDLLARHLGGTIVVCGDHGDCWGEDGLWEHGIMHPMTTTVPLLIRHRGEPVHDSGRGAVRRRLRRSLAARLPASLVRWL
jgi:hypothetical protein